MKDGLAGVGDRAACHATDRSTTWRLREDLLSAGWAWVDVVDVMDCEDPLSPYSASFRPTLSDDGATVEYSATQRALSGVLVIVGEDMAPVSHFGLIRG